MLALVALGTMLLASVGIILCNYGDQSRAVSVAWVEQQLLIPCKSLQVAHCQAVGESVSILLKEPPPEQFFDDLVTGKKMKMTRTTSLSALQTTAYGK